MEPIQELRWQLQQQKKYISALEEELWQLDAQGSAQKQLQIMANTQSTSLPSRRARGKDNGGEYRNWRNHFEDSKSADKSEMGINIHKVSASRHCE